MWIWGHNLMVPGRLHCSLQRRHGRLPIRLQDNTGPTQLVDILNKALGEPRIAVALLRSSVGQQHAGRLVLHNNDIDGRLALDRVLLRGGD